MLVIGGKGRNGGPASTPVEPAYAPGPIADQDLQQDPVEAEIARALNGYHVGLVQETVVRESRGVTVHMGVDGTVRRVEFAERVPLYHDVDAMGEIVVETIRAATEAAGARRRELMADMTFFGDPALERARRMVDDPEGNLDELSAVRYW